jgi:hypothetical protein
VFLAQLAIERIEQLLLARLQPGIGIAQELLRVRPRPRR